MTDQHKIQTFEKYQTAYLRESAFKLHYDQCSDARKQKLQPIEEASQEYTGMRLGGGS